MKGYLLALSEPDHSSLSANRAYAGLARVPAYPSPVSEEAHAMEEYVFGEYIQDPKQGLVPTLRKARELLQLFSGSPRAFDLLFCDSSDVSEDHAHRKGFTCLGFDVAGPGSFWSVVGDFPGDVRMRTYLGWLNQNGLFRSREDAERFLRDYCLLELDDHDVVPFLVFGVYRVEVGP